LLCSKIVNRGGRDVSKLLSAHTDLTTRRDCYAGKLFKRFGERPVSPAWLIYQALMVQFVDGCPEWGRDPSAGFVEMLVDGDVTRPRWLRGAPGKNNGRDLPER